MEERIQDRGSWIRDSETQRPAIGDLQSAIGDRRRLVVVFDIVARGRGSSLVARRSSFVTRCLFSLARRSRRSADREI